MLLRGSSPTSEIDLQAAVNTSTDNGVPHGGLLNTFAEAVLGTDDAKLDAARTAVVEALGPAALVDAAGVIGAFMQMDRIADATGLPLDEFVVEATSDIREDLGLHTFSSARNTLGDAGTLR